MDSVRWKLHEVLEAAGVSVYHFHQALAGRVSRTALYRITRGETKGVDFVVLEAVLDALEAETGTRYEVGDLIWRDSPLTPPPPSGSS
jgi:predicted nuclease with RNAse H fold